MTDPNSTPTIAPVTDSNKEFTSRDCSLIAARSADSKKATDIMVQDVRELVGVTDYFVIITAGNRNQVRSIIDTIEEDLRLKAHVKPIHREETVDGTWELLDYGSFVVHVFQPETRDFYRLETLWNDAPIVDLSGEEGFEELVYSERIAQMIEQHKAE